MNNNQTVQCQRCGQIIPLHLMFIHNREECIPDPEFQQQQNNLNNQQNIAQNVQLQPNSYTESLISRSLQKCEYCQEYFPNEIIDQHLQVCDAYKQVMELQNQFYSEESSIRPQQQIRDNYQIERENDNNEIENNFEDQDNDNNTGYQVITQEQMLPDGSIRRTVTKTRNTGGVSFVQTQTIDSYGNSSSSQQQQQQQAQYRQQMPEVPQIPQFNQMNQRNRMPRQNDLFSQLFQNSFRNQDSNSNPFSEFMNNININRQRMNEDGFYGTRQHFPLGLLSIFSLLRNQGMSEQQINELNTLKYKASPNLAEEHRKCAICLCEYEQDEELIILPCTHRFHDKCIGNWLKNSHQCPICKNSIDSDE